MQRSSSSPAVIAGIMLAAFGAYANPLPAQASPLTKEVRKELRGLPNYGVFDLLTFKANPDGSVTLGGYVLNASLKTDAEKAVAGVKGVTKVDNQIELAPTSINDDDIRRKIYRAIYRDPMLVRYGTAADEAAVSRAGFRPWGEGFSGFGEMRGPRWTGTPFLGQEPVGDYAIHILVKNGTATLAGEVDSDADKTEAGLQSGRVSPVKVNNDLHVKNSKK